MVIVASETPVERPKSKQRQFCSGKRKRHTIKKEVLIGRHTGHILATANGPGRYHDLRLRRQRGSRLPAEVHAIVDLRCQGFQHEHRLSVLPFKASKRRPLDALERTINRVQARLQIMVEDVIRRLKLVLDSCPALL